eukprot:1187631-Prorocentrum_minimum.AAC.1
MLSERQRGVASILKTRGSRVARAKRAAGKRAAASTYSGWGERGGLGLPPDRVGVCQKRMQKGWRRA